jgi:hypothetical protein
MILPPGVRIENKDRGLKPRYCYSSNQKNRISAVLFLDIIAAHFATHSLLFATHLPL